MSACTCDECVLRRAGMTVPARPSKEFQLGYLTAVQDMADKLQAMINGGGARKGKSGDGDPTT